MSARDLVGRPLVPFFDAEDNVNEALQVDMATQAQEQLDVDARVWDRELGYFVYPNEDASTSQHSHSHSQPIAIKKTNASSAPATASADAAGSYGKLLLTPDMLSRSAPSNHSSGMEQMQNHINHNHAEAASATNSRAATPRSTSAKRSSRQKSRSSTPNKSRNKQQSPPSAQTQGQPSDGGSSGGEDRTTGSDGSEKGKGKKNNKNGEPGSAKKTKNKQQQQQQQQQTPKSKDELSGNGKWAWSAFQSSPDPKSLPLPPFVAGGGISPGAGALPPPLDPPKIEERLDPPPPVLLDRPPSVPPDAPPLASIEHSMTQDLRRMLNIGS